MSILLILHILAGSWAITGSLMQRFQPLVAMAATVISGIGLAFNGASLGRSCLSFAVFSAALLAVRRYNMQPARVKPRQR